MKDIEQTIEDLVKLKRFTDICKSPDEFFRHMQGHKTELSLVSASFDVALKSKEIIQVLKKQIPKKVEYTPFCPVCGEYVKEDSGYCLDCGQTLDWGIK